MATTEELSRGLGEVVKATTLLFVALVDALDKHGALGKKDMAAGLLALADRIKSDPGPASMLRLVADGLAEPTIPPPRWTPVVITGTSEDEQPDNDSKN